MPRLWTRELEDKPQPRPTNRTWHFLGGIVSALERPVSGQDFHDLGLLENARNTRTSTDGDTEIIINGHHTQEKED